MQYRLCEWEENGYNDSDGYLAYFGTEDGKVHAVCTWTTRFAGPFTPHPSIMPTYEIVLQACAWLEELIYIMIHAAEHDAINEPQSVEVGERVRLVQGHRSQRKETAEEFCLKCDGTGKWVNPHNPEDERKCYGCDGTGMHKRVVGKLKGADGKVIYDAFEPGLLGTVTWVGTFRTIYDRGYNHLDRSTLQCMVRTDDGRTLSVPLYKLALDKQPLSDEELRQRAHALSLDCQFGKVLSMRHAWDSHNWALEVLHNHQLQTLEVQPA